MDEDLKKLRTKNDDEYELQKVNTVIIGGWSSNCGNCGGNAFPDEGSHITVRHDMKEIFVDDKSGSGKDRIIPAEPGVAGCGTEWLYMTSHYHGKNIKDTCLRTWPQYEWIGD